MLPNPRVLLTFDEVQNPLRMPRKTTSEPNFQKSSEHVVLLTFWLGNVLCATTACTCSTCQLPKVVRGLTCFVHFDLDMCFAPNSVHFFDISTSKNGLRPSVFYTFDFEMCFAPQRSALLRHLNFQKCSEPEVSLAFSLANVLRATTACNLSSLIWPDGSAPAALASLLVDPPEPQIIGKTQWIATFLPFHAPASSFFSLFLFSDLLSSALLPPLWLLPPLLFHLSILSEVWLLNFLRSKEITRNSAHFHLYTLHLLMPRQICKSALVFFSSPDLHRFI